MRYDRAEPSGELFTTIVTYEEQCRGWLGVLSKARNLDEQIKYYGKLGEHLNFYQKFVVLPFNAAAAVRFQSLRGSGLRISTMDLKIASITLSLDAVLYTRNSRDFSRIPQLKFEDASR